MSALTETQTILNDAATEHGPAIVGLGRGWGTGTGVVIAPGQVLTVAHVLGRPHRGRRRAPDAQATDELTVAFADGTRRVATIAGRDADLDLAVLSVDTGDAPAIALPGAATETPVPAPAIGQAVIALADPGGRGLRVTHGFISSTGRRWRGPGGPRLATALEHTAPLARGSSGAPLLDLDGHLLGLNAVRAPGGLILAIALDATVAERVTALAGGTATERPRLGVALAPPRAGRELRRAVGLPDRDGLLVRGVADGSPAAAAGVRRGDLIVSLAGSPTASIDELHAAVTTLTPGTPAPLTVVRGTDEHSVEVILEATA